MYITQNELVISSIISCIVCLIFHILCHDYSDFLKRNMGVKRRCDDVIDDLSSLRVITAC